VLELENVLAIRRAALMRFSKYAVPSDQPLSVLQDALAPLYLLHQYELKAAASMLGGYIYRYAMRDGEPPMPVPAANQRQALKALLAALDVQALSPDPHVLALMSPRPPTFPPSPETFSGDTGQIFDALRPVEDAADLVMKEALKPERAARLAQAKAHDPNAPDLDEVLSAIVTQTWKASPQEGTAGASQRAIALTVLRSILSTATSKGAPMAVRGACWAALDDILKWIESHPEPDWRDANAFATHAIDAAGRKVSAFDLPDRLPIPLDPMGEPQ
jgi:Met-zincin